MMYERVWEMPNLYLLTLIEGWRQYLEGDVGMVNRGG
jgi:hypothetical protein